MEVPLVYRERERQSVHMMATLHYERRQRALQDAYKLIKHASEQAGPPLSQQKRLNSRKPSIGEQLQLFDKETWNDLKWIRGPKLRKRFVSQLSFRDIGEIRLVMGELNTVQLTGQVAILTVIENNQQMEIVFGKDFIQEPLNQRYLNHFYLLQQYIGKPFTCIGSIHPSQEVGKLQCQIQFGTDFKMNNLNLVEIALRG